MNSDSFLCCALRKSAMHDPLPPDTNPAADVDNARRGFMQSALLAAGATQLPLVQAAIPDKVDAAIRRTSRRAR
jgi:hypothetical protein